MNKRIDELFGQTMDQVVPETWTTLTHGQLLMVKDKFAELLVRECGEVAYKAYWDNPETVKGIHIKEAIQEHFGVE